MNIHICNDQLIAIEANTDETPDDASVKTVVESTLAEREIENWSSVEISQFTLNNKRLIIAVPVKVYMPAILAALAGDLA